MKKGFDNLPKVLFFFSLTVSVYAYGVFSHKHKLFPYLQLREAVHDLKATLKEADNITKLSPKYFLQPARNQGNGVTVNELPIDNSDLILLSGFFENNNELRLIRRNGEILARWNIHFSELFPDTSHLKNPPATDWNVDTHGALILPDGAIVFNFEYAGLVKLDRCGKVIWSLPRATHHSVERSEKGGYWVPGRREHSAGTPSKFPPFEPPFTEDTILRISEDGRVIREISVPELFYRSGLDSLLTATGHAFDKSMNWDREIVHLNKVAELSNELAKDFSLFEAGDLLLSIREMNLIMVIDPDNETIKWWQIGPWLRQHDPEFKTGGLITLFNNNIYRAELKEKYISDVSIPRVSNIIEVNPLSREYKVLYGGKVNQQLLTVIRGKQEITSGGGLLITEFEGGRVLETDAKGHVIWEYINRYDSDHVAEITEARVYPADYFSISEWTCEHH